MVLSTSTRVLPFILIGLLFGSICSAQHVAPFGHAMPRGHATPRMGPTRTTRPYYPQGYRPQSTYRGASTLPGSYQQNNFQNFGQPTPNSGGPQMSQNSQVYPNMGVSKSVSAKSENLRVLDELGIMVRTFTKNAISRLVITDVAIGGLAHRNGLVPGDMIVRANQKTITTANDLAVAALRSNKSIYLVIQSQSGAMRNVRIDAIIANQDQGNRQSSNRPPPATPDPAPRAVPDSPNPTASKKPNPNQSRFKTYDPRRIR